MNHKQDRETGTGIPHAIAVYFRCSPGRNFRIRTTISAKKIYSPEFTCFDSQSESRPCFQSSFGSGGSGGSGESMEYLLGLQGKEFMLRLCIWYIFQMMYYVF